MRASLPVHIQLNEFEQALFEQIDFGSNPGSLIAEASGKASRQLMESLYQRDAIPAVRHAYFSRPFPGGRGKSHLEAFQSSLRGRKGHIFEDSSFVRGFVRYFIHGPDLPQSTIGRFCEMARGDDLRGLRGFVREQVRAAGPANRRRTAEEFYKLALECFPDDPVTPRRIREAGMQVR